MLKVPAKTSEDLARKVSTKKPVAVNEKVLVAVPAPAKSSAKPKVTKDAEAKAPLLKVDDCSKKSATISVQELFAKMRNNVNKTANKVFG